MATRPVAIDVRFVAATNRDLKAEVKAGRFRADLYHRLSELSIRLPSLNERREDIPLLVQYFLGRACAELDTPAKQCSDDALAVLTAHSWPGNVRELENTIKRAVILSSDPLLVPADFEGLEPATVEASRPVTSSDSSLEALVDAKLRASFTGIEKLETGDIHTMVLEQVERPLIRLILEKTRWNQVKAADILGINRNTLRKKIHELGIELKRD